MESPRTIGISAGTTSSSWHRAAISNGPAFGSPALETNYHFAGSGVPVGGGTAIGLLADESWMSYRAMTRAREAFVLIEKFQ
ncbi:MAG TPA: hypothetical protein VMH81_28865 [Bryobacteraceae bacterium]|nr:hypothetical protein [Bryobacteraceae bacterium]